jgi:hypothetical protein
MTWPMCIESLEGPRPVYKKKGFFFSYRSRIVPKSLHTPIQHRPDVINNRSSPFGDKPLTEKQCPAQISMRFVPSQALKPIQCRLINLPGPKLFNELVIVDSIFVRRDNFPGIDDLLALLDVCVCSVLGDVSCLFCLGMLVQRHFGEDREGMAIAAVHECQDESGKLKSP